MWVTILLLTSGICSARVLNQDPSETPEGGGFLSSELPLQIVVTTPSKLADNTTERLTVLGQQALMVVYSRSVIALGQDFGTTFLPDDKIPFFLEPEIPGRFRWVTTFVARWDPDEKWPLDSEIKFTFNENLTTHDGILLRFDGLGGSVILRTPSLSIDIGAVSSGIAFNRTDDGWNPFSGLESDVLPEVPPDGVIRLSFNTKVSLTALQNNLKVLNDSSKEPAEGLGIKVQPCDPSESGGSFSPKPCLRCKVPLESEKNEEENACAEVTINGDLQMETRYALYLGEGVEYSENAGALKAGKNVTFGGLRKFKIPFPEPTEGDSTSISTNFLRMWLPHGLEKTADSDLQTLKQQFTIATEDGNEVDFDLKLENNSNLRILTSLIPETNYTISVDSSSDVSDGFGLPLEASSIKISTGKVGNFFGTIRKDSGFAIFEASEDWGRKIATLFRGNPNFSCPVEEKNTVNIFPVTASTSFRKLAEYFKLFYINKPAAVSQALGEPIGKIQQQNDGAAELVEFDIEKYLKPTGLVAAEFCSRNRVEFMLINESDMQAIILGSNNGQSIVWVTSLKTGNPIEGAKVTLYRFQSPLRELGELPKSVGVNVTDAEGNAFFDGLSKTDVALVEFRQKSLFLRKIFHDTGDFGRRSVSLVLDRRLVKPGDTLHIKGYSRGKKLAKRTVVRISPAFDRESSKNPAFPIELDEKFGTFELEIAVPENARSTDYRITLESKRDTLAEEDFTVGDPRPPTAGLTVDAPFWSKPDSKVMVNITAESFIGAAVGDAKIILDWSIPVLFFEEKVEGEIEVVTDSLGKASTEIDLGSLEKIPSTETSLNIEVFWVGPTREFLKETASVLLRNADMEIDFDRSVETDFPGQEFGVRISLTDLKGEPLEDRTLVVNLKQISNPDIDRRKLPSESSQPLDEPIVDSCEIQSNSKGYDCRFSIPDLGLFALETCVEREGKLCRIAKLGDRTFLPVDHPLEIGLVSLTEGPHKVRDRLKFGIENPYENAKALIMWGSPSGVDHMMMPINDSSLHEFSIDLSENCERACTLSVGVVVPRQKEGIAMNPKGVPISKNFDLAMPHAVELTSDIDVQTDTPLNVEITFPSIQEDEAKDFVVSPGETTTIQVNITDPEIDEAEVTVIVVDKAVLELLPLALKNLTNDLELINDFEIGFSFSGHDLVPPRGMQNLIQDFITKKEIDPWFDILFKLSTGEIDTTEQQYVNSRSDFVTVEENKRRAVLREAVAKIGGPISRVRLLKDFVSTALFETVIAKNGMTSVNFTPPDNLGTFSVRTYVATESEKYGSVEKELIVRRPISLTSSAPRFARVGDEFEAGAVVTVSGPNPSDANVSITIDLLGEVSLEIVGESERAVKAGDDGTEEVRFRFKAKQMGDAKFKITAEIGPSASDALIINFPVEGLQEGVTVASSFAIDGNSCSQFQEGLQLPQAVPGSGAVTIRAGVGRLPAVLSMAGQIYESNPDHECPIDAGFPLALVTIPFVTETYKVLDLEQSSLDRNTVEVINGIQSNFTSGLESLQEMTREDIGLDYFLNCKRFPRSFPTQPSLTVNARGVFLLKLLKEDLDTLEREVVKNGIPPLKSLNEEWISALETALLNEASFSRENKRAVYSGSLAFARAALGGDWVPPSNTSEQIVEDLSMDRLSEEFDLMSVESQASYILARISMDGGETHPDIQRAMDLWTSNFRVTGRTAYIANSKGSSTPASNIANSLALMVMVRTKVENTLVDKLANYVSSPVASNFGFRVFSDFDKAVAVTALRDFDVDRGSDQPDLKLEVRSGESNLLDVSFTGNANPVASSSTPWEDLASPPEPIEFRADGNGEVALAAAITFVPSKLLPFPTYRGIFVQRAIYITDSEDANKISLTTIPVTSVVEVSVQITTADRLGPTTVRVLMPAGLEPVDPSIDGSEGSCPRLFASFFEGSSFIFSNCPDQETEPSVVTFSFNSVTAGTHAVSFRAVASTAGTFALPPVKAFMNEQPEVMGLSPGGELEICSGAECAAVEDAMPKIPKSCPGNCSDSGACDLDSGECLCFDGFNGDDCGELEVA